MRQLRAITGSMIGVLLLAVMVACGSASQATSIPLISATATPTTGPTATATSSRPGGPPASPIIARPTESPIIARPTGSPSLPFTSGPPSTTPSANAVAPNSDGTCPASHPIKGAQLGPVKTYFLSDSAGYANARASECFANEADADAAGYRKAQR